MSIESERRLGTNFVENREKPLWGKVALITGSSRDIGAGIAITLAKEGVQIIGNYRDPKKEKRAVIIEQAIERMGVYANFVRADIAVPLERSELVKALRPFGGRLNFLILNTAGTAQSAKDVSVISNNALVDEVLPKMPEGAKIVFMQSVAAHFAPQLRRLNKMGFYDPIAEAKYEGEQSLRVRIPQFQEKNVSFIVVCPPIVLDTSNVKMFDRESKRTSGVTATEQHAEISDMLGIPRSVRINDVGEKIAELLKRKDLPMGYVELFGNVMDARSILSEWYGENAIFVDTVEITNQVQHRGIGRMIVARDYTKGHFNKRVRIEALPAHIMIEAAAQTLGLIVLNGKIDGNNSMPLFQETGKGVFFKIARPGDALKIRAEVTEVTKRGFVGNATITNIKEEKVAEIVGTILTNNFLPINSTSSNRSGIVLTP